ncbi:MAG: dienelactone hydrolase family protein [Pseudomonadota bacterium]
MTQSDWVVFPSLADDFELSAWRTPAIGPRKGGLVLIQEIFGVTDDLKRVCDDFAAEGYDVLAPSLFDRFERRVVLDHATEDGMARARRYASENPWELVVGDVQAAIDYLRPMGSVFLTGFCYGGAVTWVCAARCEGVSAASGYYGRLIVEFLDDAPKCPTILHFGRTDPIIPMADVDAIQRAYPDLPVHIYEAGHGFVSNRSADYSPDAAALSKSRTLALFESNR